MTRLSLIFFGILLLIVPAAAQHDGHKEMNSKGEPVVKSKDNAPVELKAGEKITRGAALAKGLKKTTVAKAFAQPGKLEGNTFEVSGVIVRSCKTEGC